MTTSDADTDFKLNIIISFFVRSWASLYANGISYLKVAMHFA